MERRVTAAGELARGRGSPKRVIGSSRGRSDPQAMRLWNSACPLLLVLAVLSAVTGSTLVGPATADVAGSTRTYSASTAAIANPERGMFHFTSTHYRPDRSGHIPLDAAQLAQWRTGEAMTLAFRIFYLERFVGQDTIDPEYLELLRADLEAARSAGVKLVVRFAYSDVSGADAPAARVRSHIHQLAPVLNGSADVIAVLQAGFIGQWGEWYYTENFASDPSRPWVLSDADWAARGSVLDALLAETDSQMFVQVRYPGIKQRLLPEGDPRAGRVGIHNDCFLASDADWGTFLQDADRTWLADQTRTVPMGGETCHVNEPRSLWPSASADLAAYHWSYLNADYHPDVLASWGAEGRAEAARRLGYRLRLTQSTAPASVTAGSPLTLSVTLVNDGYAAPFRPRPVRLVLRSATATHAVDLPVDLRAAVPGAALQIPVTIPAPPLAGTYAVRLALPDASPRLRDHPGYRVQLANVGTWDAGLGENDLQQSVVVEAADTVVAPSPVPTAPPPVRVSSLPASAVTNGWGPMEINRSNGGKAAGDGRVQSIRGTTFDHGLGVHASSSATFAVPGGYCTLRATLGVDDETKGAGSVVFAVYADGVLRYRSPRLTGRSAPLPVTVDMAGAASMRLVVTTAGDGKDSDHADWAGAELH